MLAQDVMITSARTVEQRRSRPRLSDEAESYIRDLIMAGELRPGQFIRQERVADFLGMSATPVREGLLALRGDGFVTLEARRGFVVSSLTSADVGDLFWAQALIAGELAARAVVNLNERDVSQLDQLQAELTAHAKLAEYDEMQRINHLFHSRLNHVANSPKMAWLLSVSARYVPRRFYSTIEGWPDSSIQDHLVLLRALHSGDAEAARLAMQKHIVHAGELLAGHRERVAGSQLNAID